MDCIDCKVTNPDGNRFCGQCGAELGRLLDETIRKRGFRDRQATEMEITEAVAGRLMKWAAWLGTMAALVVFLFGLLLGKSYHDVWKAVDTAKTQIQSSIEQGQADIVKISTRTSGLADEINELQEDIDSYRRVNRDIEKLQKQLQSVQVQVVDLGPRGLTGEQARDYGGRPKRDNSWPFGLSVFHRRR